jgi:P pilus assembly chaperone PapD
MHLLGRFGASLAAVAFVFFGLASSPARAGVGDLLVAPTRLVLNGGRGTEVILKNVGEETATYRVSVELRRMMPNGALADVTEPTPAEKAAQDMIVFAPRKVVLPPQQPQSVRIAARAPAGLPDGEYRAHILFRAIPDPKPVGSDTPAEGVGFRLTPIYGVTIPVIVRLGNLQATAGIADVKLGSMQGHKVIEVDLTRSGDRSVYGELKVLKDGMKEPLAELRGVAVYREIERRTVTLPIAAEDEAKAVGPVRVQYFETSDSGSKLVAETSAILR